MNLFTPPLGFTVISLREFTAAEVATHKSATDCWLIISGRVYDVSDFLSRHPAGGKIIQMHGGRDCTSAFLDVHAEAYLTQFLPASALVGVLAGSGATAPAAKFVGRYWAPDEVLLSRRTVFGAEHGQFRSELRQFLQQQRAGAFEQWEAKGQPDVATLRALVKAGYYLRLSIPKEFGGLGLTDWRYHAVVAEEIEYAGGGSSWLGLGNDMSIGYFTHTATAAQQAKWLPRIVAEGSVIAIAMSEPELGSDLATLATTAKRSADGKSYILNGRKMWISAGSTADIAVISAVTDASKGRSGISLFAVEKGTAGFEVAKRFAKLGKHASDTCLLTLTDVEVPAENLIGKEGGGLQSLLANLPVERLSMAVGSAAAARRALAITLSYVHGRQMFGGTMAQLQSVQHKLAQLRVDIQMVSAAVDSCIAAQAAGTLTADAAAAVKVAATELASRVADTCLQMFGGYGYLKNNPVGKIFVDQRVTRIYGGANEVLLEVIGKGLGFKPQRMRMQPQPQTSHAHAHRSKL